MGNRLLRDKQGNRVFLKHSARARRMTLRVSALDGKVTLTVPIGTPESRAMSFVMGRSDWIEKARKDSVKRISIDACEEVPIEGDVVSLIFGRDRRAQRKDNEVYLPERNPGAALRSFLKDLAQLRVSELVEKHARPLGAHWNRVSLRDTRSRWGSCTAQGNLMVSWRLIMAPPEILDYVVAHEVAHLIELNHSERFWALVEKRCPGYRVQKAWLRQNGPQLHKYQFD